MEHTIICLRFKVYLFSPLFLLIIFANEKNINFRYYLPKGFFIKNVFVEASVFKYMLMFSCLSCCL